MLNDTSFNRPAAARLQVPPPAVVKAAVAPPMSSSLVAGTGRSRLQAKKLEAKKVEKDLWDDF